MLQTASQATLPPTAATTPARTERLCNARIVTRSGIVHGTLVLEDGIITEVRPGIEHTGLDCDGDVLIPGIIDIHTDNLEKHFYPRPNIDWNPVSAAIVHDGLCISVGITTVFNSLSVGSFGFGAARTPDNLHKLSDAMNQAADAGMLKADHRIHWRCEAPSDVLGAWLPDLAAKPRTGLLSLMDHTPGQRQYRKTHNFFDMWRKEGLSDRDIEARMTELRERVARNDRRHRDMVAALSRIGAIPLAAHDDESAAHIDEAASLGVTIAEFPVTLEAAQAASAAGMTVVMGGPNLIRGGSYSGNVSAAELIEAGISIGFASDYVPRSLIECAFALTRPPFHMPIEQAVDTVSGIPARAVGLTDRGALVPGLRADVVRVRVLDGHATVRGVWTGGVRA